MLTFLIIASSLRVEMAASSKVRICTIGKNYINFGII